MCAVTHLWAASVPPGMRIPTWTRVPHTRPQPHGDRVRDACVGRTLGHPQNRNLLPIGGEYSQASHRPVPSSDDRRRREQEPLALRAVTVGGMIFRL